MRRLLGGALSLSLLLSASGCSGETIYSDYREIDQLELVQTIGVDLEDGELRATVATGGEDGGTVVLSNLGRTVSWTIKEMQNFTSKKYLFFGHIRNFLIGEAAAREDMTQYLDYIERSVELRLGTGIYIVKGSTAQEAMVSASGEKSGITELLESLEKDVELLSESYVFSCGEIVQALEKSGCALVAAIEPVEEEGIVEGDDRNTVRSAGYAVIKDDRAVCFMDTDAACGANIVTGRFRSDVAELPDGADGWASVKVTRAKAKVEPRMEDGRLVGVVIRAELRANVEEIKGSVNVRESETLTALSRGLEELERSRIAEAVLLSQQTGADFLGIGDKIGAERLGKKGAFSGDWEETLAGLEVRVEVQADIERTYDTEKAAEHERTASGK